jgi:hypothetical protein
MWPRIPFVRVADEHGNEYSLPESSTLPDGHTILPDKVAVDGNGDPLPVKEHGTLAANVAAGLKGQALDAALDKASLPKDGTADEKRARLAEHAQPEAVTEAEARTDTQEEQQS